MRTRDEARTDSFSGLYGTPIWTPQAHYRQSVSRMWRPMNTAQMAQASLLADTIVDAAYEAGLQITKAVNCAANDGVRPTYGLALALMRHGADFRPLWPAEHTQQRSALHRALIWECPLWLLIPLAFVPFAIVQLLTFGGPLYGWLTHHTP